MKTAVLLALLFVVGYVRSESDPSSNLLSEDDSHGANSTIKFRLPEQVYRKAHKIMMGSKELRHMNFEQVVNHIDSLDLWEAPQEIVDDFPYYLAGYDFEDRPIWVAEAGKYDVRKWVRKGGEDLKNVEKYMFQATVRILKSIVERDTPENPVNQGVFFGDTEGLDMTQVAHIPTVRFVIGQALKWRDIVALTMGRLIVINANYPTQLVVELARPIAGKLMERVEVFGTNKAKWMAELRRFLPEDAIPTWYGGKKSFKPVLAFG